MTRDRAQSVPCETVGCPFAHGHRAHGPVKIDAWLVPVKAAPFQTPAATCNGDGREALQQGFAIAISALFRQDKQVLQIDARAPQEGGKIVEKEGHADRKPLFLADQNLGLFLLKNPFPQQGVVRDYLVGHVLVICQGVNKS